MAISSASVDPVVEAANATAEQALRAGRDHRVRESQVAVYLDAIAAVNKRQDQRQKALRTQSFIQDDSAAAETAAAEPAPAATDWSLAEARLLAFGSATVLAALRASSRADTAARTVFANWKFIADQNREANLARVQGMSGAFPADNAMAAHDAINPALQPPIS